MIQFTIEDQHKKKLRVTAPHSWNELNTEQLLAIENEKFQKNGLTKLFSIICGLDFESIAASTDRTIFKRIEEVCEFISKPPQWEHIECPEHIEIGYEVYKVQKNVSKLMHGQIELLTELGGNKENLLELMPRVVAIIMQPHMDKGIYDGDRVDHIEKQVLKSSALQVYGMASFFFGKLEDSLSIGVSNSIKYLKQATRKATYYSDWLKVEGLEDIRQ